MLQTELIRSSPREKRWKGRREAEECDVVLFADDGGTTGAWEEELEAERWMVS
jgi:hypothetical protein